MITRLDVNSDMGERDTPDGRSLDAELMPFITSVNIACGGHAGTPELMRRTAELASQYGVGIGAHPGFRDRRRLGRSEQSASAQEVEALVVDQVATLADVLGRDRLTLTHVKPHGALYNMAARNPHVAQAIVHAVQAVNPTLLLYALAGSVLAQAAQAAGLFVVHEAFVDRAYRADGSLLPRSEPGALLCTDELVRLRLGQLIMGSVTSVEGTTIPVHADSLCLHADTPHAVALARLVRQELQAAGIRVAAPHP